MQERFILPPQVVNRRWFHKLFDSMTSGDSVMMIRTPVGAHVVKEAGTEPTGSIVLTTTMGERFLIASSRFKDAYIKTVNNSVIFESREDDRVTTVLEINMFELKPLDIQENF